MSDRPGVAARLGLTPALGSFVRQAGTGDINRHAVTRIPHEEAYDEPRLGMPDQLTIGAGSGSFVKAGVKSCPCLTASRRSYRTVRPASRCRAR